MLKLSLFGGFQLTDSAGRTIEIALAKPRALLAYLALHPGRTFERGPLAGLLWGGMEEGRARHSLTQALSSIAVALGSEAEALERGRTQVLLRADAVDVDLLRFHANATADHPKRLAEAVAAFDPTLFADIAVDEPAFEEWVTLMREDGRALAMRAGMAYLAHDQVQTDPTGCLTVARKLLRLDPFHEAAHRAVIRAHVLQGDTAAALRQAESCRTLLKTELGVAPAPETERAIGAIHDARPAETSAADEPAGDREIPSIVIPALQNLTGDPGLEHICQGLSEDIITELARYRSIFVISLESAFQVACRQETAGQLCRRLGVRHVLCGSLRRQRGQFRVTLRLIEGASGRTVWSERYDIGREEVSEVGDDVTEHIVARLSVSLEEEALAQTRRKRPSDWSAYDHLLQGLAHHHRSWFATGTLMGAIRHFRRAIEIDPDFARGHAYLACAISAPWYKDREPKSLDRCLDHARRAVELDPFEAEAQRVLGGVYLTRGEHDLAAHHFRQALRVHPGNAHVLAHAAKYDAHVGENGTAIAQLNRARQLNPLHPAWYWQHLGIAMFGQGEYAKAAQMFGRLKEPVFYDRLYLSAANAHLGRFPAAERHLQLALQAKPGLDAQTVGRFLPYSRPEDQMSVVSGLQMAGLR